MFFTYTRRVCNFKPHLFVTDTDSSSIITNYHEASSQSIIFCDISRDTITSMDKNDATFPGDPAVIRLDSDAEQMSGNEEEEMDGMSLELTKQV